MEKITISENHEYTCCCGKHWQYAIHYLWDEEAKEIEKEERKIKNGFKNA
jgi:hypothetical protein